MNAAKFEVLCILSAELFHMNIQTYMDENECPTWQLDEMYDTMNEDVSRYYTKEMQQSDLSHENYFAGSADEWDAYIFDKNKVTP